MRGSTSSPHSRRRRQRQSWSICDSSRVASSSIERQSRRPSRTTGLRGPGLRSVLTCLLAGATACASGSADCVIPPCALPVAVTVAVTSSISGGAVAGSFVQARGYSSPLPCNQSPGTTCYVLGSAGTYQLDIGAPGFQTVHIAVEVKGTSAKCGCGTVEAAHLSIALVPTP
jgi:hypothetical protein